VAPAKPPPMTMTRADALCAIAGNGTSVAAAAPAARFRNWRRLARSRVPPILLSLILRAIPVRARPDLVVRYALGDAIHHGGGRLAGAERLHGGNRPGRIAAGTARNRARYF